MNIKVFVLVVAAITVGLVELIVGGVLPQIASDLHITIGTAGQLITVFAIVYAISGPVLLSITSKIERKKLLILTLIIFFTGNILTYFSQTFTWIMVARVITAASASLVIVLALTITGKIVQAKNRAKAIGFIFMGVSSALVLGVPIGIVIADIAGWRALFLMIAGVTILTTILVYFLFGKIQSETPMPLSMQIKALGNVKIAGAHFATMFMLAGHYTFYAYFTPFLEQTMELSQQWISICYFLFGIAAVAGGAMGGALADKFGPKKTILSVISTFAVALFILSYTTFSFPLFLVMMMLWGALSWSLAPPQQAYIIESDPVTAEIHQSFNNSALQVGIALGSGIGGLVISQTNHITTIANVGAIVVVVALICAIFSLTRPITEVK